MRTNVEAARDGGVNLGFFAANVCFWQVHFDADERSFTVDKNGYTDLWRVYEPEISMMGVEYVYNSVDMDMTMRTNLASGSGIGGHHWTYDYAGLSGGDTLPGLLGYEVDGCWPGEACRDFATDCPDTNSTVILADSVFWDCGIGAGHSYMTIYTNSSRAQVFATGSMQWNWGLDDFGSQFASGSTSRVHRAAQQMTHNVLRTFSGRTTTPVIFKNLDSGTAGDWTNSYGLDGHWIAETTPLTNSPSYAQVFIQGHQTQVWTNQATDPKALLKPPTFTNRVAAAWTTTDTQNSTFTIDLNLTDTNKHQIALYCVDWLGTGTTHQKIDVFDYDDTSFSNPLDTRHFLLPSNGVYNVWRLSGHKIFRVSKLDSTVGAKAMISAILFGGGE